MASCSTLNEPACAWRWATHVGLLCLGLCAASAAWGSVLSPPVAPVKPVTDDYFGVKVTDGDAKTKAGFESLYAVDVLHHVKDATAYPATLLTGAVNDPRVSVWQPANVGGRPVVLRIDADAASPIGPMSREDELLADQLAFMLWQVEDLEFQAGATGPAGRDVAHAIGLETHSKSGSSEVMSACP